MLQSSHLHFILFNRSDDLELCHRQSARSIVVWLIVCMGLVTIVCTVCYVGMSKEVEHLILENTELLATK